MDICRPLEIIGKRMEKPEKHFLWLYMHLQYVHVLKSVLDGYTNICKVKKKKNDKVY